MRNTVVNRITDLAFKDENIFFITGDAGFGVLDKYKTDFPDRFLNLGIAEQNMISFASGLALTGYKVFVYNIAPFVLYRCYEQVRNDICYQNLPVTLIGIGSGLTYAPQGVTHYSVEDIALARTLPNLVILSPADPLEAVKCAEFAYKSKKPVYIRLAKSGEPIIHKQKVKSITEPIVLNEGEEVMILFHGSVGVEVMGLSAKLKKKPLILSVPMLQPLNLEFLSGKIKNIRSIVTIEEHFVEGGLGSIIAEWIAKEKLPVKLIKLGVKNEFIHIIKNNAGMRRHYGFSSDKIAEAVNELF
jgi:transketolase